MLASVEMMVLSTLAGTCPPLITFVVYFCVWHSVDRPPLLLFVDAPPRQALSRTEWAIRHVYKNEENQ